MRCGNASKNTTQVEEFLDRQDAQASVQSPSLGSAWCVKAGLSCRVIGSEGKRNDVSCRGVLKGGQFNLQYNGWFAPDYVGRIKFDAVANIDVMGYRGHC
jgi:hypothetical protein